MLVKQTWAKIDEGGRTWNNCKGGEKNRGTMYLGYVKKKKKRRKRTQGNELLSGGGREKNVKDDN